MGLIVNVYRSPAMGDCTGGGVSSRHDALCVVNASGPFEPSSDAPPVFLESHRSGILRIVPAFKDKDGRYKAVPMLSCMGGNYAATSDSRFSDLCEMLSGHSFYGAVAIHDRFE